MAGFYDYGPPGCAIKQAVTQTWRNHFVLEEGMLEVECPAVTPEIVLKASGHVERFTDFMVTDAKVGGWVGGFALWPARRPVFTTSAPR